MNVGLYPKARLVHLPSMTHSAKPNTCYWGVVRWRKSWALGLESKLAVAAMSLHFLHKIILSESRNPRHVVNSFAYIWFKFPCCLVQGKPKKHRQPQHHTHVHCWTTTLTNLVSKQGSESSWHHLFALPRRSWRTPWHPILSIHTNLAITVPAEQCVLSIYVNYKFNTLDLIKVGVQKAKSSMSSSRFKGLSPLKI